MKPILFAPWLCAAALAHAEPLSPAALVVTNPRDVMLAALASADGTAHGVLQGALADAIGRTFQTDQPIRIDITTEKRYVQAGCSRLTVVLSQVGVQLPHATAARTETITFGANYCRDGLPPRTLATR